MTQGIIKGRKGEVKKEYEKQKMGGGPAKEENSLSRLQLMMESHINIAFKVT